MPQSIIIYLLLGLLYTAIHAKTVYKTVVDYRKDGGIFHPFVTAIITILVVTIGWPYWTLKTITKLFTKKKNATSY